MNELKFTVNDEDYIEFNRHYLTHSPDNKKLIAMTRLMMPVMFSLLLLIDFLGKESFDGFLFFSLFLFYAFISTIFFFVVKPLFLFLIKIHIKTMKKHGKLPYGKDVILRVEEEALIEITPEIETKVKYTTIEKIDTGKNAIYIYMNRLQAVIVPFSAFETETSRNEFLYFMQGKAAKVVHTIK